MFKYDDNLLSSSHSLSIFLAALSTTIQTQPASRYTEGHSSSASLGILIKFVSSDIINRQGNIHIIFLSFGHDIFDNLGSFFIISMYLSTLRKVKDILPPMIISLILSSILLINWILTATLTLPKIARKGHSGLSKALAKEFSSFFIKNPPAFCGRFILTMELWAWCPVPKVSLT